MATFGVRNFESWFVDIQDLLNGGYTIRVLPSKTQRERIARALPRIWIDRIGLRCPSPLKQPDPNKTHGELGDAVTHMFTNKGLPGPYNLRHGWRERAIRYGIDPSVAARSLGHSVI
ncbi:MAG: hypothetical protein HC921_21390 [Synechococcaceae cyanobacterium SM2_3_1]|nr:hypothetical protein [Synechococcaceae cyanobacterium SM2_3_1]